MRKMSVKHAQRVNMRPYIAIPVLRKVRNADFEHYLYQSLIDYCHDVQISYIHLKIMRWKMFGW